MFIQKDNSFNDIRYKSLMKWLDEMEQHKDLEVSGGVVLARSYIQHLINENNSLKNENELKKQYMQKLMEKR